MRNPSDAIVPPGWRRSFTRRFIGAELSGSSWEDQPWLVVDCKENASKRITTPPTATIGLDASRPFICIPVRPLVRFFHCLV
jgi:hypothetical protein